MSLIHVDEPTRPREGLYERIKAWLSPDGPWLWLIYLPLYGMTWIWVPPGPRDLLVAAVALPVFLFLYLNGHAAVPAGIRAVPWIAGIIGLAFVIDQFTIANWGVIVVYAFALAGSLRPQRLAILVVLASAVALTVFSIASSTHPSIWLSGLVFGLITAVANFFSSELTAKNAALLASQGEVRALAAQAERERIARDLHDLLGHTLTVVAVKADLAARLVDLDPARAKSEMQDLQVTARTALADIRSAVSGMRRIALGAEVAQARNALAAVDTTLAIKAPDVTLPALVEETLAMLLREGATNVVRHARASKCEVVIDVDPHEVRFTLSDDGVGGVIQEGNGLAGMRARVAAAGGRLDVRGGQGTRIEAVLPLGAAA